MKRNRDADNLSHRLDRAANIIPEIRDHLDEQRALVHAIGGQGDGGGRQGGTHSDPTLRAVAKLDAIDQRWRDILDALASIGVGVNLLDDACRAALGTRGQPAAASEPKCTGGDPSAWGDPTCGELVMWHLSMSGHVTHDRDGLCVKHRKACDEWQRAADAQRAEESNARRKRRHNAA